MIEELQYSIISFTEYPGPRYIKQGDFSGEFLYIKHLKPLFEEAIKRNVKLVVNLDGTAGYAASFIDEVFGNIVYDFGIELFNKHIKIISNEEPEWLDVIDDVKSQWQLKKTQGLPRNPNIEK